MHEEGVENGEAELMETWRRLELMLSSANQKTSTTFVNIY